MINTSTPTTETLLFIAESDEARELKTPQAQNDPLEPSDDLINRILSFSKALQVNPSKSMGYVENLLN